MIRIWFSALGQPLWESKHHLLLLHCQACCQPMSLGSYTRAAISSSHVTSPKGPNTGPKTVHLPSSVCANFTLYIPLNEWVSTSVWCVFTHTHDQNSGKNTDFGVRLEFKSWHPVKEVSTPPPWGGLNECSLNTTRPEEHEEFQQLPISVYCKTRNPASTVNYKTSQITLKVFRLGLRAVKLINVCNKSG